MNHHLKPELVNKIAEVKIQKIYQKYIKDEVFVKSIRFIKAMDDDSVAIKGSTRFFLKLLDIMEYELSKQKESKKK